jgi:hypothetical protein
VDLLATSF